MLFRDRPLLPNVDSGLYVARPSLEDALLHPLRQGRNVLLLGDPGSGKTTLMQQIAAKLRWEGKETVWVNASLADSAADLLAMVEESLRGDRPLPYDLREEAMNSARLLALMQALTARSPAVIVVDNLSNPDISFDLFGRLRDELWAAGHTWLVAARPKDSGIFRSPPAEAFWAGVVEIPPLDEREVAEFLRRGLNDEEREGLQQIPIKGFHPRLLIREVEAGLNSPEKEDRPEQSHFEALFQQAARLGRSEEIVLRELVNLGRPVSAHDPELLGPLGWSRPYLQRILSHLEAAHLVRSIPEPTGERTGRPRKLYEPNPSAVS